jgi:hypothetical protein
MKIKLLFVFIIGLLLTSCEKGECIESHIEYIFIPIDGANPSNALNRQPVVVCDSIKK